MSEETKPEKKHLFSKTWTKVTAGVLGGALILGGTFATGAIAGARCVPPGFDRVAMFDNSQQRHQPLIFSQASDRVQGMDKSQSSSRGRMISDRNLDRRNLSEVERLVRINEWLDSIDLEPLAELPDELSGTAEELRDRKKLEKINHRLEKLGLEPLDELPEDSPTS